MPCVRMSLYIKTMCSLLFTESTKRQFLYTQTVSGKKLTYVKIEDLYFYGYEKALRYFDPEPLLAALPNMKGRDDGVLVCGCNRSGNYTIFFSDEIILA